LDDAVAVLQVSVWPPEAITTGRLVIREPQESDRNGFIGLLTSSKARRFLGGPITPQDAEMAVTGPYGRTPGSFVATLSGSGSFVGTIGLDRRDRDRPGHRLPDGLELEVSYVIDPAHWGRGYATEAVSAVLAWAAGVLPDREVVACTQTANVASTALLERLGFSRAGPDFVEFDAEQSLWARSLAA
jgi:RimJ/RimL family protein N-acetyltransferase